MKRWYSVAIAALIGAQVLFAATSPSLAQTTGKVYRLGHLGTAASSEAFTREITLPELAKLGFVEGRNLVFDGRAGEPNALAGLVRDLLGAQPDAVVAIGPAAVAAAGSATRKVAIVGFGADPIELGLAVSYARPGTNVTGLVILASDLEAKRLSILHEAVPDRRRIAVLISSTTAATSNSEAVMQKAAISLGVEMLVFPVSVPADYPAAFAAMRAAGAQALVIGATPDFQRDAKLLSDFALEARLPTICEWADMARSGCLIGYGPSRAEMRKRMAHQIAAIFRGSPVSEIPIELPVLFEFAVNQKTAKSLGLTMPAGVLLRADEVID